MNTISPRMVRALTTAIVRKASKHYPGSGAVGVYGFMGKEYHNKADLRVAVKDFCEGLTYDKVPIVRENLGLV